MAESKRCLLNRIEALWEEARSDLVPPPKRMAVIQCEMIYLSSLLKGAK